MNRNKVFFSIMFSKKSFAYIFFNEHMWTTYSDYTLHRIGVHLKIDNFQCVDCGLSLTQH